MDNDQNHGLVTFTLSPPNNENANINIHVPEYTDPSEVTFLAQEHFELALYFRNGIVLPTIEMGPIIDVGAHVGFFCLSCLHMELDRRKDAMKSNEVDNLIRVVCIEPIPKTYAALEKNVGAFKNVLTLQCAVGSNTDTEFQEMLFYPHLPGHSTAISKTEATTKNTSTSKNTSTLSSGLVNERLREHVERVNVRKRTLSSILSELNIRKVGLLKIDVEGSEIDVLEGLDHDGWNNVSQVVVETAGLKNLKGVVGVLERVGFRVKAEPHCLIPVESLVVLVYGVKFKDGF
ncbi:hypothetical protein HDU76_005368 [Blyttiomyces sp. JEL0837]|nr:hypothetical protein HDU76_005368 [Blyttiomyces sp. JEL0837]